MRMIGQGGARGGLTVEDLRMHQKMKRKMKVMTRMKARSLRVEKAQHKDLNLDQLITVTQMRMRMMKRLILMKLKRRTRILTMSKKMMMIVKITKTMMITLTKMTMMMMLSLQKRKGIPLMNVFIDCLERV
jgi:hypothetical protein